MYTDLVSNRALSCETQTTCIDYYFTSNTNFKFKIVKFKNAEKRIFEIKSEVNEMETQNSQPLIFNLNNFIYEYQVRIHTEAICTDVYVSETGYPRVVIEFSLIDSEAIKELGNTFKLALPSINQAVEKPYSYNVLFKSVAYDIPMDDQGNVDLVDLKGKSFALSIEKKSFDNGDVVPRLINLIAYRD